MSASTKWKIGALAIVTAAAAGLTGRGPEEATAQEREDRDRVVERRAPEVRVFRSGGTWLGVGIEDVDDEAVSELGLPEERGARVMDVVEESPAAEAGLREGDVIWRWNDEPVASAAELQRLVRETPAGRTVRLEVFRDGTSRELGVELAEGHRARARELRVMGPHMDSLRERLRGLRRSGEGREFFFARPRARMGVELRDLTDGLEEYFGVTDRGGALVASVREGSPAAEGGLRAGDVILSVAGEEVARPADVIRSLRDREAGPVEVRVMRRGEERTLTVELEEREDPGFGEGGAWWFDFGRAGDIVAAAPAAPPRPGAVRAPAPAPPTEPLVAPRPMELDAPGPRMLRPPAPWPPDAPLAGPAGLIYL